MITHLVGLFTNGTQTSGFKKTKDVFTTKETTALGVMIHARAMYKNI